jgi:hypothetical protein
MKRSRAWLVSGLWVIRSVIKSYLLSHSYNLYLTCYVDESEVDESEVDESEVDESEVDESEVGESEVDESELIVDRSRLSYNGSYL